MLKFVHASTDRLVKRLHYWTITLHGNYRGTKTLIHSYLIPPRRYLALTALPNYLKIDLHEQSKYFTTNTVRK